MHEFAFIFRATLPVSDLAKRNSAARQWALDRRAEGVLLQASPLLEEGRIVTRDGVREVMDATAVASVLVVAASDLEAAVALAKTHPGLAFGTEIEVRAVKPTNPPADRRP